MKLYRIFEILSGLSMQLSSKGRYAVMAMADLAHFAGKTSPVRPIPIAAIAERQNISQAFLEQIFMYFRQRVMSFDFRERAFRNRIANEASSFRKGFESEG